MMTVTSTPAGPQRRDRAQWGDSLEAWRRVFVNGGHSAFRSGPFTIRETVYGIAKRLRVFLDSIEGYRERRGIRAWDVRVLDLGCGTGVNLTTPLAAAGYRIVGLEADLPSLVQGKRVASAGSSPSPAFVAGELGRLPFTLGVSFDVVICSEVLEHVEDVGAVLADAGRLLRPGGLLLLSIPNPYGYFELESLVWRWLNARPWLVSRLYSWESRFFERWGSPRLRRRRKREYEPSRLRMIQSTLAADQGHAHALSSTALTQPRLVRQLGEAGWRVVREGNTTLLAGNLAGLLLRELDGPLRWNGAVADLLPWFMVSDWLVVAERPGEDATECPHRVSVTTQRPLDGREWLGWALMGPFPTPTHPLTPFHGCFSAQQGQN